MKHFLTAAFLFLAAVFSVNCSASPAINFSNWELDLPIGPLKDATIVSSSKLQTGFSNPYFYVAKDGGQVFMVPSEGSTTPRTLHPRTELREIQNNVPAAWSPSGMNVMSVTGKVMQVGGGVVPGPNGIPHTTIAQIYDSNIHVPFIELQYYNTYGGFGILIQKKNVNVKVPCKLKTPYTAQLSLTENILQVKINGTVVYSLPLPAEQQNDKFYFKCGNYDQTAQAGSPPGTTPYTVVKNYAIDVIHKPAPSV